MGKRNKIVQIIILSVILVVGGYAIGTALLKPSNTAPVVGSTIPDIALQMADGEVKSFNDFEGKALVLNFWGTWCEPCEREMPALQQAWEKWKPEGVEVIGINIGEDKLVVQNYMKKVNVHFPMMLDLKFKARDAFNARGLPATFFVKPDRTVQAIHVGELTTEMLDNYIQQIVNAKR
ncbi:redoxin domain-containing protein [Paenibacillus sp. 481]|nr:redoxin domain-containing protein [Paenibacillus sp. 481]